MEKILLVDNDDIRAECRANYLADKGYQVTTCCHDEVAYRALRDNYHKIFLTMRKNDEEDVLDTLAYLRKKKLHVKTVVGYEKSINGIRQAIIDLGATPFDLYNSDANEIAKALK
jgi:DNA-binding NarL/FixJ family response regulator